MGTCLFREEYRQVLISYSIFSMVIDLYNSAREHVALGQGDICSFVRDSRNRGQAEVCN